VEVVTPTVALFVEDADVVDPPDPVVPLPPQPVSARAIPTTTDEYEEYFMPTSKKPTLHKLQPGRTT